MKRIVLLLTLAATLSCAFADNDIKYWDEGALKWEDFIGKPAAKTTLTFFKGRLEIRTDVDRRQIDRFSDETEIRHRAEAVMYKKLSYADTAGMTSQMLRYHQLQFDLLELYRRRLQADLNGGLTDDEAMRRLNHYQDLYDEQIVDIARTTVNGSNGNRVRDNEYFVKKQLEEYNLPKATVSTPSKFSYGWYAGTGAMIPVGGIEDAFDFSWLFNLGLTAGYDRVFLKADVSYGQPRLADLRKELFGVNREWAVNRYASQLSGVVALGYRLIDTKSFAIAVNAGSGWTKYSWNVADFKINEDNTSGNPETEYVRDSELRSRSVGNFNYMFGFDFDWKFHTLVSENSFLASGNRVRYTSSLRLSPYVMRQKYSDLKIGGSGFQVGIVLTYTGLARALGAKF